MNRSLLPLLLLLLSALLWGCFPGGATETETGTAQLTGEVKWPDGRPAVGARVRLRPSDFLAAASPEPAGEGPFVRDTVTDAAGRFVLIRVPVGAYHVEALHSEGYGALASLEVAEGERRVGTGVLTLQACLSVTGRVRFADSTLGPAGVHVLGTEHWALADSATGNFALRDLPPGVFDLRVSTPVPFFPSKDFPGQVVEGTASVDLGDLVLDKAPKQAYSLAGGRLTLEGVDGANPILYDNDFGANTWDNEFLWALASRGKVDLRGHIATLVPRDSQDVMPVEFAKLIREARICRLSGMRNIPEPILGASRKLALPPGGRWQDIQLESNPGIRLLVDAARSASVEKPLVVVAGGSLSTVANAVLLDPSIVDKMVVFGAYNNDLNAKDSLASYLVARKCRFVEWGRDYFWAGPGPSAAALPQNWMGRQLTAFRDSTFFPPLFFADFAALPFLVDGRSWKSARVARVLSPPLNVSLEASGPFDFIDIPQDANDWALMDQVFFSVLADSGAYHPWPVPGQVEGVSFRALSGAAADSVAGEGDAVTGIGAGDWMEYALEVAAEGDYDVTLRYRCSAQAAVQLTGGAAAATPADLDLPAGTAWVETRARIRMGKGTQLFRVSTQGGSWQLSRLRLERAP
jgi:hypothetical protein